MVILVFLVILILGNLVILVFWVILQVYSPPEINIPRLKCGIGVRSSDWLNLKVLDETASPKARFLATSRVGTRGPLARAHQLNFQNTRITRITQNIQNTKTTWNARSTRNTRITGKYPQYQDSRNKV
jgi:hypothetical protein